MQKIDLSWDEVVARAGLICTQIIRQNPTLDLSLYGVPRGGIYPVLIVAGIFEKPVRIVEDPTEATVIIDDIIDTGSTRQCYESKYGKPFYALIDKTAIESCAYLDYWVSFPWERMEAEDSPTQNIVRLLEYIGEDPRREGLRETPQRVIKSYETLFGGYHQKPEDVLKVFKDGSCDEMVLLRDCEFVSCCEHHMLPFLGKAHIAYIPNGTVIGVSKLARILEIYARRLQIQERLGQQVTTCLDSLLHPKGSACILEAQHLCMTTRGVKKQSSVMVTSSLTGVFREDARTRSELMSMLK